MQGTSIEATCAEINRWKEDILNEIGSLLDLQIVAPRLLVVHLVFQGSDCLHIVATINSFLKLEYGPLANERVSRRRLRSDIWYGLILSS